MCCDFHIGEDYGNETQQCNMQCESIIIGDLKQKDKVKELPKTDLKESRELKQDVLQRKSRNLSKHPHTHNKKKLSSRRKKLRPSPKTPKFETLQKTTPQNKKKGRSPNQNIQGNPKAAAANEKLKNFFKLNSSK